MGGNIEVYILVAVCGMLIGIVGTLLIVIFPMNSRISKNETNISNLMEWTPKIANSVDVVINQNNTLIAELRACHRKT